MEAIAIVAVLWLLARKKQQGDSTATATTPAAPTVTTSATEGAGGGLAGVLGTVATAAGLVVKIVGGVGGGTAATTAATTAAVGGTAAAGAAVGAVMVVVLMNPYAWVIYFLIGTIVSRHNEIAKNFLDACRNMAPNARALHEYERWLFEEFRQHTVIVGSVSLSEVRDGRLDKRWREGNGSVTLQGWRTVVSFGAKPPPPPPRIGDGVYPPPEPVLWSTKAELDALFKKIRACALIYLQERGRYGYAILSNKPGFPAPTTSDGWGLDEFNMQHRYDIEPGLGGLMQVPLLHGEVEAGYRDEIENPYPPVDQLRGTNTDPDFTGLAVSDLQTARFAALIDAICLFRHDQTIDLREPGPWSDDLFRWLGQPSGLERSGRTWICDPAIYGARYVLDVWAAKTGTGRIVSL